MDKTTDTQINAGDTEARPSEVAAPCDCSALRYELQVGDVVYLRCKVARLGDNCVVSVKPCDMDFPSAWLNVHRNEIVVPNKQFGMNQKQDGKMHPLEIEEAKHE